MPPLRVEPTWALILPLWPVRKESLHWFFFFHWKWSFSNQDLAGGGGWGEEALTFDYRYKCWMQVDKWPISKTTIVDSPKVYDLPSHGLLQATAGGMNSLLWSSPHVFGVWDRVHYIEGVALCLSLPHARTIGVRHHTQLGGITSMVTKLRRVIMIDNNYLCISKHAMILQFNRQKLNIPSTKKC